MTTKKIKTSDILGDNYYIYELTSSNYTPALNDTITITCTMKDVYGAAASGKSITLYQNGTSKGAQTTNSSGVATWSITCSTAGPQKFNIKDRNIEVFVDISDSVLYEKEELELGTPTTSSNAEFKFSYYGDHSFTISTLNTVGLPYPSFPYGSYDSIEIDLDISFPSQDFILILNNLAIFRYNDTTSYGRYNQYEEYNLADVVQLYMGSKLTLQFSNYGIRAFLHDEYNTYVDIEYSIYDIKYSDNITINSITAKNWKIPTLLSKFVDDIQKIGQLQDGTDLNELYSDKIYLGSNDTYTHISNCPVENASLILINRNITPPGESSDKVAQQTLLTARYGENIQIWVRYHSRYGSGSSWTKLMNAADFIMDQINLSASKQKLDENEKFIIFANVKDKDGNPTENKNLTLMQQYDTYSNPDMGATGYVRDEGFYVNDTIFKGDWSCSFKVNSTPDHTGLQLYISSEQRILFSTLGATSTSEIEITCSDNTITINVDGANYGTTYTQNSNGTKVGFFTHEDYSVNIKDFVVNSGMLYKDCGSQTTDSNGNCSWSFNDGLPKGLYSFYIDNVAVDVFVGLFVDTTKIIYKSDMTANDNNWIHSHGSSLPTITYTANGCTVTGTRTYDRYYKLNTKIKYPFCFVCEFDIISTTQGDYTESTDFVVGNIQIRQQNNQLRIGDENRVNDYVTTMPTLPIHIKVEYGISSAIVYVNGLAIGSWATNYDYIGFKTYKNRSITIKNLEIRTFDSQDWYDINIADFSGNETIIDDHIAAGSSVKFTYNKTDSTDCEGYIQLGYPMPIPYGDDNFISIGVIEDSGGGLNKVSILDNVTGDEWSIDLPNKNSFDIEIRVPNFEYNLFDLGATVEWYIAIVIDGVTRQLSAQYAYSSSDNVYIFKRNNIYKVVQDTNSTITNLHYIRSTNSDIVSQNDNRLVTSNAVYDSIKGKMDSSLVEPVELVVTYTDNTTETIPLLKYLGS